MTTPLTSFIKLALPGVQRLQPYLPGKPVSELEREYGIKDIIKLASNENPLGPGPRALEALKNAVGEIARYPDGACFELRTRLAAHHGVEIGQVTLGNGSNDVLELIARAYVGTGDEVIFSQHAFAVYPIVTQAVGGASVTAPAKNWGYDLDAIAKLITTKTRIIFIANPNNPTGTWLTADQLDRFLSHIPERILVVLDEAYFEYAHNPAMGSPQYPDASAWLPKYANLVVTRTFSKAYGLAGLRVGYALSNPQVADILNRVRQPFNVNSLAQVAACAAMDDVDHLQKSVQLVCDGLKQLQAGFDEMGLESIPSVGNFICVSTGGDAAPVYEMLLRQGVIVRPVANYGMPQHLRITIGLPSENERFLTALKKALA